MSDDNMAAAQCDHPVWVTHVLGGEPLSVSICQLCGGINWNELRAEFEAKAGLREAFASEDGAVICWKGKNYISQEAFGPPGEELARLQSGLRERGWTLDHCGEEELVDLALAALDERDADAKALSKILSHTGSRNGNWYAVEHLKLQMALIKRGLQEADDEGKVTSVAFELLSELDELRLKVKELEAFLLDLKADDEDKAARKEESQL